MIIIIIKFGIDEVDCHFIPHLFYYSKTDTKLIGFLKRYGRVCFAGSLFRKIVMLRFKRIMGSIWNRRKFLLYST